MKDTAIQSLISHSFNLSLEDAARGYESLNDNVSGDTISRIAGVIGTLWHGATFFPELHLLMNALPIIQGILLLALYTFLALAIPFSSYRIGFCVGGSIVMFSVIFCSYIWHLVHWVDSSLIPALFPSTDMMMGLQEVLSSTGSGSGFFTNALLINMVIGTAYIVLPLFWMTMMTWAGFKAGSTISGALSPMSAPAKAAGSKAGRCGNASWQCSIIIEEERVRKAKTSAEN